MKGFGKLHLGWAVSKARTRTTACYQDVIVEVDLPHLRLVRTRAIPFRSTVLNALKETVSPGVVLNLTVAGFLTVFTPTNLTFREAMLA
jgi:hypothetical protein